MSNKTDYKDSEQSSSNHYNYNLIKFILTHRYYL